MPVVALYRLHFLKTELFRAPSTLDNGLHDLEYSVSLCNTSSWSSSPIQHVHSLIWRCQSTFAVKRVTKWELYHVRRESGHCERKKHGPKNKQSQMYSNLELLMGGAIPKIGAHITLRNGKIDPMQRATYIFIPAFFSHIRVMCVTPKLETVTDRFDLIVKNWFHATKINKNASGTGEQDGKLEELFSDLNHEKDDMNEKHRHKRIHPPLKIQMRLGRHKRSGRRSNRQSLWRWRTRNCSWLTGQSQLDGKRRVSAKRSTASS